MHLFCSDDDAGRHAPLFERFEVFQMCEVRQDFTCLPLDKRCGFREQFQVVVVSGQLQALFVGMLIAVVLFPGTT
jgi:hypothetical protein